MGHGEVVRDLGGGWFLAWDTTEVDSRVQRAMDRAVADHLRAFMEAITLEEAEHG